MVLTTTAEASESALLSKKTMTKMEAEVALEIAEEAMETAEAAMEVVEAMVIVEEAMEVEEVMVVIEAEEATVVKEATREKMKDKLTKMKFSSETFLSRQLKMMCTHFSSKQVMSKTLQ